MAIPDEKANRTAGADPGNGERRSEASTSDDPNDVGTEGEAGTEDNCAEVADLVAKARFDALRNAMYHTARRRSLEAYDRWGNFFVVVFGAAAVTKLLSTRGPELGWSEIFGFITATIGAAKLAFNFGARARDHERFQRRYYDLLAEITEADPVQWPAMVAKWQAMIVKITSDESPTISVVDAIAYNDAANAIGVDADELLVIPLRMRVLGRIFALTGHRYCTLGELKALRAEREAVGWRKAWIALSEWLSGWRNSVTRHSEASTGTLSPHTKEPHLSDDR